MIEFVHGDIFATPVDIRVNTVNCVGVMGAGVALAFKQHYPEMFKEYQRDCKDGLIRPGKLHVWRSLSDDWVVNFPTKRDWREPSRYEDISDGLDALREYLNTLGPVSVAVPALGCGNGGLDWDRVSKMIEDKLSDVDAHIRVFAPSASRQAGRAAAKEPTEDELRSAEGLGYTRVSASLLDELGVGGVVFAKGKLETLEQHWIALLPSRSPGAREQNALQLVAAELANRGRETCVALLHSNRASEEIAKIFSGHGIDTVILLPFGVLTRKSAARMGTTGGAGSITLISAASPSAKWSRALVAQAMDVLRARASAMLLSDPEPDWLIRRVPRSWRQRPIFFLRYDTLPDELLQGLAHIGATPIGRRADIGVPNLDGILATQIANPGWKNDSGPSKNESNQSLANSPERGEDTS